MRDTALIIAILLLAAFILSPASIVAIQGDSMEPTIPNDALIFSYETSSYQTGDIVTFYSEQTNGYVTHRIIEQTETGEFITRGDNNAVPDQEIGINALQPQDINSKIIEFNGSPLYIPYIGLFFLLFQKNLIPLIAIILFVMFLLYTIKNRVNTNRLYSQLIAKDVFQPIFVVTLVLLILVFMFNAAILSVPFVYTESESTATQQYVIQTNQPEPIEEVSINSTDSWFTQEIYIIEGFEPIRIDHTQDQTHILAQLPTQKTPGSYQTTVSIYTIPAVLPQALAQQLAYITPILPITLSSIIILLPLYLIYRFYVGANTPIRNPTITRQIEKWSK